MAQVYLQTLTFFYIEKNMLIIDGKYNNGTYTFQPSTE